ncbi:MAG: ParB/RepB/Spo0J family partition protein [Acutalibacteraceae bacterium]|nr:ParB/RepB/Spo0J family partition protein [Acutalibacteraceae bacterium]
MAAKSKRGGLGKGLDAIFIENEPEESNSAITLKISEIEPNKSQPRREFDENALAELADSIAQHGVLQPLLVRPIADGGYQIVAGERRWRASRMAGLTEVPVVIRELTDSETMELALIENLQREDLTPVEEALGYKQLMDEYGFSQEQVSKTVGKSRPAIANALRLLNLPEEILYLVNSGKISSGHGRTLLAFKNPDDMLKAAKLCTEEEISVRELERMVKRSNEEFENKDKEEKPPKKEKRLSYYDEVELSLNEHLGRKVNVTGDSKNKGVLEIEFYSKEDLFELARILGKNSM